MRKFVAIFIVPILLIGCQKEEIRPDTEDINGVECGCEYTYFTSGIPPWVKDRALYPEFFTMDHLVNTFVHYLNTSDREGLESLLVTEDEFTKWIYPEYNIANPNCNIPSEMIYSSLQNKSIEGMDHMQTEFFGRDLEYVDLEISNEKQEEEFESYTFFNRTLIHVTSADGPEIIGMTGTIVSLNNRFKLLSYRENNHIPQ